MDIELAEKIRALKEKHGFSYKKIAEAVGCDISTIYRVRDGLITNPSYLIGKAINDLFLIQGSVEPGRAKDKLGKLSFKKALLRSDS
ncbi:helix-turn-helix domain-containing protein [Marinospirillum insulare]|uniref:HTH merR-type domain-containing protein n=1 Tax=Marinospirillum insulare TaxID=217169 RepID=A0ABQ5ZVA3_9GAMM|nr:helix-turn-helix transcriptional regulator [Marinospirillum insulare]GLR63934.1 hypothetical protein GCM10007878_13720 [Marinospirillum insulare]